MTMAPTIMPAMAQPLACFEAASAAVRSPESQAVFTRAPITSATTPSGMHKMVAMMPSGMKELGRPAPAVGIAGAGPGAAGQAPGTTGAAG